ncbi:hypothetical protein E4P40_01475 [Blastococcus sp. CT_GayMR20]|uniref:hypothetical protein n=1 Tax=Blastococcus sp. CT_GayMR20 TaxID=2559609 RepID=UPI001074324A|nr:hypothetical protein [Blastococcus sp. CT_GayMR20]TFV92826.1 hypothetical protein E4P40_01400 [Blastococcus sp. CT_GayMR20]TFV92837.1 hypothetical protein E4P40_01475 [Blastococcus sp. CT_GayMR20]
MGRGAHRRRSNHRVGGLLLGVLLIAVLVVVLAEPVAEPRGDRPSADATTAPSEPPTTTAPVVEETSPYAGVGTWLSRYRFTREFGGAVPPVTPAVVDTMAEAGIRTIYLQPAADDPRYPGLLSTDVLGDFLVRAHARDMQVVAWYLPRFGDIAGDLRRLEAIAEFRVDGQGFDAVAVDIEFTDAVALAPRNAALIELSQQLRAALPDVELGAVVLPPVVTDVLNSGYWPEFPWAELRDLYDVWLPMAYWSNRSEEGFTDPHWYVTENIERVRRHLDDPCATVSVIGGYDAQETSDDYSAMARAATEQQAIGVSIWDWPTTPPSAWPAVEDYDVSGC